MNRSLAILATLLFAATLNAQHLADPSTSKPLTRTVVNVNTANETQLMFLPGIGEVLAGRIVEYRYGVETGVAHPFKVPADLMRVKGIKAGKFAKIASYVVVTGATTASAKIHPPKV